MKGATPTSSSSQNGEVSRNRMDSLFLKFAACYGHAWRSQLKHEQFISFMKEEWSQALIDIKDTVLESAIKVCMANKELPPTLPQFIEICKSIEKKNAVFKVTPSTKPKTPAIAEFNLSQMKKILNIKS
ncbi:Legionella vir region protein LvrB [Legionella micdadei]|uniref:Legionella vir region protein LvrB n=2 Tax=Legionella micdadei TaxID=451 RepID=A0A098GI93_LEGMI|nr:Legionella vir region protein [Legionella micdadei]CEG62209.1 Legionella vir region protein LvrB [Legionella micdadei]SCY07283.1 hypothetical protein SAMN02982997_00785 [Legionella micdadei]